MKKRMHDISDIRTGIYLQGEPDADTLYLQLSDFDACGRYKAMSFPYLKGDRVKARHLLRNGDLLFAAKGLYNFCTMYSSDEIGKAVASSSFLVIHIVEPQSVLPEYVRWFLNRDDILKHLQAQAEGGGILSITKAQVEALEMKIPTVPMQKKILEIDELQRRSNALRSQITEKQQLLISLLLTEATKKQ